VTAPNAGHASNLPLTGERTVPGIPEENYWFRRHEAAYEFALPLVVGKRVLEVGCGEGYGTALLATRAAAVIGVDYDAVTIAHCGRTYPQAHFVRANLAALPFASRSIDVVATLQVIEHVWNAGEFIRECRRVLRPGALLLVTTPNRLTFSPGLDEPVNPFHVHEYVAAELTALLVRNGFTIESVLGLHAGPAIADLDRRYGSFVDTQLAMPPEEWPAELLADVASVGTADFDVADANEFDVGAALDLIALARCPV
jgi:SAM-dependent methyltransferase